MVCGTLERTFQSVCGYPGRTVCDCSLWGAGTCTVSRSGYSCTPNAACSPTDPSPCKTYGWSCDDEHRTKTCVASANRPDGIPCASPALYCVAGACTTCNDLALPDLVVYPLDVAANGPAPLGGSIADGTYVLTDSTYYTGPSGSAGPLSSPESSAVAVLGGTVQIVMRTGPTPVTEHASGTFTTSGVEISGILTCPAAGPMTQTYTATPTTLALYTSVTLPISGAATLERVYALRSPSGDTLPAAPTGVIATAGDSQVTLSWNAVPGAASYDLYWSTVPGQVRAAGNRITRVTSPYVHAGLVPDTTYSYVVTAVNAAGESAGSSPVSATPPASAPPPTPAKVAATQGNAQVTVTWAPAPGARSYNIYWSTEPGVTPASGTRIAGATSPYVQTGLTNGTTYRYVVAAANSAGESPASPEVSATPALEPPPAAPSGVAAAPGNTLVTVSWTSVPGATSYNVYWSTTPGVTLAPGNRIAGARSPYLHTGLDNGAAYHYVVTALSVAGESAASSEVSAIPSASLPPPVPGGLTATPGVAQIDVSWQPVPGATSYNLYWSTAPGVTPAAGTRIAGATSPYGHTGLTSGTTYYYVVTAVNAVAESAASSQASATWTLDVTPPDTSITSRPPQLANATSATFAFASTEPGGAFDCRLDGSPFTPCTSPTTYNGLGEGAHAFSVRAVDPTGNADPTPAVATWTIDLVPPTVVAFGPPEDAADVPTGEFLYVIFSKEMDPASLTPATLSVAGVAGTVQLVDGKVAVWVPTSALASGTTHFAELSTGARDLAGNSVVSSLSWSFTTASGGAVPTLYAFTTDGGRVLGAVGSTTHYRFDAAAGDHYLLILSAAENRDTFAVRVKRGSLPTPTDFDFAGSGSQAIQISNATAGTYYVGVQLTGDWNYLGCCPGGAFSLALRPYWPDWVWGWRYAYRFSQTGANYYRQCTTSTGGTLTIAATPEETRDGFALYVKRGSLPTASDYDAVGSTQAPLIIPGALPGTYYVWMVMTSDYDYLNCCPGGTLTIEPSFR